MEVLIGCLEVLNMVFRGANRLFLTFARYANMAERTLRLPSGVSPLSVSPTDTFD